MQLEEDISGGEFEANLPALAGQCLDRLTETLTAIRTTYRRDHSAHALIVRWLMGMPGSRIYEVLVEISFPYEVGETLWPFTMEEEMDLIEHSEDRWDVEEVSIHQEGTNGLRGKVLLRRHPNRSLY